MLPSQEYVTLQGAVMGGMEQWWNDYWQGKRKKLREKLVAIPFCPSLMLRYMLYRANINLITSCNSVVLKVIHAERLLEVTVHIHFL